LVSSWSINFLSIAMGLVSYFLLPMAVYTVLFTPSKAHETIPWD
jgi:hypothetical protein